MVVHQNITNLAGYFHFLNVRKIPYVITGTIGPAGDRMSFFSRFKINLVNGGFTTTAMKLDGTALSHDQMLEIFKAMCQ